MRLLILLVRFCRLVADTKGNFFTLEHAPSIFDRRDLGFSGHERFGALFHEHDNGNGNFQYFATRTQLGNDCDAAALQQGLALKRNICIDNFLRATDCGKHPAFSFV